MNHSSPTPNGHTRDNRRTDKGYNLVDERFRKVIENVHESIAVTNARGLIVVWNHSLENATGLNPAAVFGHSARPDSAGCQFFVCLGDASFLNMKYTAFGKVIKGDDVLGKLGDAETVKSRGGEKSKPVKRQGVETIKIVPRSSLQ